MTLGVLADAQRRLMTRRLPEISLFVSVLFLAATMLIQAPVVEVRSGVGTYLVRSWDIAAVATGGIATWWLLRREGSVASLRLGVDRPLLLFGLWVLVAIASLVLTWATFGSDGLVDSLVRGLRLVGVLVLAVVVGHVARGRRGEYLVVALLVVASAAAADAAVAWLSQEKMIGDEVLGVTRAGGPFGNYYADGMPDQWWAGPAAANNLGLWIAMALATLGPGAPRLVALGRHRTVGWITVGVAFVLLSAGLLATHSRESWIAAAVATLTLLLTRLRRARRSWHLALFAIVVILALAVFASVPSISGRIGETFTPGTFSYETGPRARINAWEDGLRWGWARFPVGWGMGAMEEHPERFGRATAENVFIQAFVSAGLLGFVLLVAACVLALVEALRRYGADMDDLGAVLPAAFFTAFCVHGLFGNSLTDPTIETLLGCALGLLLARMAAKRSLQSTAG